MARPRPRAAPVTNATLPVRSKRGKSLVTISISLNAEGHKYTSTHLQDEVTFSLLDSRCALENPWAGRVLKCMLPRMRGRQKDIREHDRPVLPSPVLDTLAAG